MTIYLSYSIEVGKSVQGKYTVTLQQNFDIGPKLSDRELETSKMMLELFPDDGEQQQRIFVGRVLRGDRSKSC